MIRISQLKLPCGYTEGALENKIRKTLRIQDRPLHFTIVRHSVDARKKPLLFDMYTVDVDTKLSPKEEASLLRRLKNKNITPAPRDQYRFPDPGSRILPHRPVVIGAGPAGLFCALFLAEHGYRPLVIERGRRMEERTGDVESFWKAGLLDPASNVQFGEGGAGTFSDGKLNTQINDKTGRSARVLRVFVDEGAPESILYEGKPHIGTDRLRKVIPRIRERIERAGGEVRFETVCTGFTFDSASAVPGGRKLNGIKLRPAYEAGKKTDERLPDAERNTDVPVSDAENKTDERLPEQWIPAEVVVLAIGHSARDTIEELYREKIPLEQKQFAVGFRVAHPQSLINESQYGISDPAELERLRLSASPYKLTARALSGRGVYSFCMCPGGYIVNASSEKGHVCVNGMSDEGRDSGWANSAIVITVGQKEFGSSHVLAGMEFQRKLEKKAWEMGKGAVPVQNYLDFRTCFYADIHTDPDAEGSSFEEGSFFTDGIRGNCRRAPLHKLLPPDLTEDFIQGMDQFGHKIRGFDGEQAILAGVESRTSSPVRIPRTDTFESTGAEGLYPCGEGAGYAGGIMSAAMDGIRIAEAVAACFAPADPDL